MSTKKMYYIQRYDRESYPDARDATVARFLDGDYMGSSEFEFGTVPRTWRYLRTNSTKLILMAHEVTIKGGGKDGTKVTLYAISTPSGIERFKQNIDIHFDGTIVGNITKEYTDIWDRFGSTSEFGMRSSVALWLDVTGTVGIGSTVDETCEPIAFTDDFKLAVRLLCELKRLNDAPVELKMFDKVRCFTNPNVVYSVNGILENDLIVLKYKGNKVTVPNYDVWGEEEFQDSIISCMKL